LLRRLGAQRAGAARLVQGSEGDALVETRGPVRAVLASEIRERFERALETLSEGQRTVFLLRQEGDMTLAEVAGLLGVALPTVKTQFARACLRLQAGLGDFRPHEDRP
jgi:RNA polymerase sigma factor (sigma-70 family)